MDTDRLKHALASDDYPLLPWGDGPVYALSPPVVVDRPAVYRDALPYRYAGLPWWTDPWDAPCLSHWQLVKVNALDTRAQAARLLSVREEDLPDLRTAHVWLRRLAVVRLDTLIVTAPTTWRTGLAGLSAPLAEAFVTLTDGSASAVFLLLAAFLAPVAAPLPPSMLRTTPPPLTEGALRAVLRLHHLTNRDLATRLLPGITAWMQTPSFVTAAIATQVSRLLWGEAVLKRLMKVLPDWHPVPGSARVYVQRMAEEGVPALADIRLPYKPEDFPAGDSTPVFRRQIGFALRALPPRMRRTPEEWARVLGVPESVLLTAWEMGELDAPERRGGERLTWHPKDIAAWASGLRG